jgi:hypothetical protein
MSPRCIRCGFTWKTWTGQRPITKLCGQCEKERDAARDASLRCAREAVVEAARVRVHDRRVECVEALDEAIRVLEVEERWFDAAEDLKLRKNIEQSLMPGGFLERRTR